MMASKQELRSVLYAETSSSSDDEALEEEESGVKSTDDSPTIGALKAENQELKLKVAFFETIAQKTMELTETSDQQHTVAGLTAAHTDAIRALHRKHARSIKELAQRIEDLEEENETLRDENDRLKAKWSDSFDRHVELVETQEKLRKAETDWELERSEREKALDELEAVKKRAWTWEMLYKHGGEMPLE